MRFKKDNIPHNKNIQSEYVKKKVELFKLGLDINCKVHGNHSNWRMHTGNNVQCRLCSSSWAKNRRILKPLDALIRDAKGHAKVKQIEFNILEKDLENLMIIQNNRCAISGIKFSTDITPSLDKIDPTKGYTKNNIQLVTIMCNRMKSDFNQKEFIKMCKLIAENNK